MSLWFLCVCFSFVQVLLLFVLALFLFCCWIAVRVLVRLGVFVFSCCLYPFVFCCFFVFVGGFKGQVRWPKVPPHLALNPPYFCFVFCVFFGFPDFAFNRKTLFPLKMAIFVVHSSVFPFVSL